MTKSDTVGVVAVVFLTVFTIVGYMTISSAAEQRRQARADYVECVRNVPTYIDGQEALYMEQECRQGVAP